MSKTESSWKSIEAAWHLDDPAEDALHENVNEVLRELRHQRIPAAAISMLHGLLKAHENYVVEHSKVKIVPDSLMRWSSLIERSILDFVDKCGNQDKAKINAVLSAFNLPTLSDRRHSPVNFMDEMREHRRAGEITEHGFSVVREAWYRIIKSDEDWKSVYYTLKNGREYVHESEESMT